PARPSLHSFPTRRSSDLLQRSNARLEDQSEPLPESGSGDGLDRPALGWSRTAGGMRRYLVERFLFTFPTLFGVALVVFVLMRLRSEEHTSELQSRFDLVC